MAFEEYVGSEPHIYYMKWWARLYYGLFATFLSVGSVFMFAMAMAQIATGDWKSLLGIQSLPLILFPTVAFIFWMLVFSRVELSCTEITLYSYMRRKSLPISEIVSYKVLVTKNASFWKFETASGASIAIQKAFDTDEAFNQLLASLKDLSDEPDLVSLNLSDPK